MVRLGSGPTDLDQPIDTLRMLHRVEGDDQPDIGVSDEMKTLELEMPPHRLDVCDVPVDPAGQSGRVGDRLRSTTVAQVVEEDGVVRLLSGTI